MKLAIYGDMHLQGRRFFYLSKLIHSLLIPHVTTFSFSLSANEFSLLNGKIYPKKCTNYSDGYYLWELVHGQIIKLRLRTMKRAKWPRGVKSKQWRPKRAKL